MAFKLNSILSLIVIIGTLALVARAQNGNGNGILANIPGAQTATGILASSSDGMSRYLAPDGPIQPAITAIGGLPMRGAEQLNRGISSISSRLDSGAQSLSRTAGNNGNIRMPGMDALESSMPASIAQLGTMMQGAIKQKNNFIRQQADRGVQAGERLRSMMHNGFEGVKARSSGHMVGASSMMSSAQDSLMKSSSKIQGQLKESLDGTMGRMKSMQGIGDNMRNQAGGIGRTLQNGLTGAVEHIQRTGEQLQGQIQGDLHQNTQVMSGIMDSMHGSMNKMGLNMQDNFQGVVKHVQNTAEQLSSHLQQAASGPLSMIQNLGSGLGSMMQGGGGKSSGGRY